MSEKLDEEIQEKTEHDHNPVIEQKQKEPAFTGWIRFFGLLALIHYLSVHVVGETIPKFREIFNRDPIHQFSEEERKKTSIHEAGHVLVSWFSEDQRKEIKSVTIIPKKEMLGHVDDHDPRTIYSHSAMRAQIRAYLGGRAAEELVFKEIFSGSDADLKNATAVAMEIVCENGMSSELGLASYDTDIDISEARKQAVEKAVQSILDEEYAAAQQVLAAHASKLKQLAAELLIEETLNSADLERVLGQRPEDQEVQP